MKRRHYGLENLLAALLAMESYHQAAGDGKSLDEIAQK